MHGRVWPLSCTYFQYLDQETDMHVGHTASTSSESRYVEVSMCADTLFSSLGGSRAEDVACQECSSAVEAREPISVDSCRCGSSFTACIVRCSTRLLPLHTSGDVLLLWLSLTLTKELTEAQDLSSLGCCIALPSSDNQPQYLLYVNSL